MKFLRTSVDVLAAPESTRLPVDRPRGSDGVCSMMQMARRVTADVGRGLRRVSQENDAPLFATLLTGFSVLMYRHSGQSDVVVGTTIRGRNGPELRRAIGLFAADLVLRFDLSGNPAFATALQRARTVVPLARLVGESQPLPTSPAPMLRLTLDPSDTPDGVRFGDLAVELLELGPGGVPDDFAPCREGSHDDLAVQATYDAALLTGEHVGEFLDQYVHLLEQIATAPDTRVDAFSLLTPSACAILGDPTAPLDEPDYLTVGLHFEAVAVAAPERVAVTQDGRALSYGDLSRWSDAIAVSLAATVPAGSPVAVSGPRSFGLVAAALAVLRTRCVLLLVDPGLPLHRRRTILREARARHMIWIGTALPDETENPCDAGAGLDIRCVDPDAQPVTADVGTTGPFGPLMLPAPSPHDAAYVFFTSGSTGVPKGVVGSHKGLSHFLSWQRDEFAVGPGDRVAQLTCLSFDVVLRDLFLPLISGATLCLPDRAAGPTGTAVLDWLGRERVTILHTVPALAQSWLRDRPLGRVVDDLRLVFFAGEPLLDSLVTRWRDACGRQCEVVNLYGPTETSLAKYFDRVSDPPVPGIQPVGRPLPQTQTLLLGPGDVRSGLGEVGEIVIRTPFRSLGYLSDVGNRSRFVINPFTGDPRDIVYRTGDLGRLRPEGTLEILGRMDDQVKIHGVRVEPGEVAAVLSKHESVQACTVVARKDEKGVYSLHAYVVPKTGAPVHSSELRSHLTQWLPATVVPQSFVIMESLPLLPNGKVDRAALPAPERGGPAAAYRRPRGALEHRLVEIWEDVLGARPIGIDDDFFALGGSSLLGVQLVERLARQLGAAVPLVAIVEAPTIALLARRIASHPGASGSPAHVVFHGAGRRRPLFALPGIGGTAAFTFRPLAAELGSDQPVYGLQLRGLDGLAPPDRTVEEMARYQVANVRRVQASGPYSLIGYSFGGRLALEMAIQLRDLGESVELLAMIDTWGPGFPKVDALPHRLRLHLRELGSRGFLGGFHYIGERARRLLGRAGHAVSSLRPRRVRSENLEVRLTEIDRITQLASRQYVPRQYSGDMLLFRSEERSRWLGSSFDDARNGWGEFVRGKIAVRAIPGTHLQAMQPGSIRIIADCLRAALPVCGQEPGHPLRVVGDLRWPSFTK